MRRNIVIGLILMVLGIVYAGCGGPKSLTETNLGKIPKWFTKVPSDPDFLFAAKTATSKDLQLAINKAQEQARADIAQQVEVKLAGIQKNFKEEVGASDTSELLQQFTEASRAVYSESLMGSKAKEQKIVKDKGGYRAYVLMQYPIGAAAEALLKQMSQQKLLYTRFRASKTFDELNKEVEKYEQWKKEQGFH